MTADRESRAKAKTDELNAILGNKYDPFGSFDDSFFRQVDISRSESLTDKQKKFKLSFPEGELISVPTSDGHVMLARPDKNSLYQELPLAPEIVGDVVSEPFVLSLIGSYGGPLGTAIGAGVGEYAQTKIEQARGFGDGEPEGVGSAIRGAIAGATDLVTRGGARLVFGRQMTTAARESAMKAIAASKELGLEPLAVGQIAGPFGRGIFRQVGATSSKIENKITAQEESLLNAFRELADEKPANIDLVLGDVVKAQQKELSNLITLPSLSRVDSGTALQEGIKTYEKASKLHVGNLYDQAITQSDDVVFNLRPAKQLAEEVNAGVLGKGLGGDAVNVSSVPGGELKSVIDDIAALDPNVSKFSAEGKEWTAFEQLKTLRTRLFDLKSSEDGAVRREASRLWSTLTEVMDNPISGNPDFVKAYQKASAANWVREDTLEKSFVAQALRSDTPEALARKFMNPNNATALATIKDIVPQPQWEQFRTGFMVDLMNAPTATHGLNRLRNFASLDADGLNLLVSPSEQKGLTDFLVQKARFEASPLRGVITKQLTDAEKLVAVAKTGTAGDIQNAVQSAGGVKSEFATVVKAGIYKDILDQATTVNAQGVDVMDAGKLLTAIDGWKKSGKLDSVFDANDWRRIELFQKYSAPVSETADVGGAMMAGSLRQQALEAPTTVWSDAKKVYTKLVRPLMHNELTATILSRPAAYSTMAMSQTGRVPLRAAGLALGMLDAQMEYSTP